MQTTLQTTAPKKLWTVPAITAIRLASHAEGSGKPLNLVEITLGDLTLIGPLS